MSKPTEVQRRYWTESINNYTPISDYMQDTLGWYGSGSDCLLSFMKLSDKDLTPQLPQLICSLRAAHLDEQQTKWSHVNSLSVSSQFFKKKNF